MEKSLDRLQEDLASRGTARIFIEIFVFFTEFIIGILGNFLVVWVLYKKRRDGKVIHYFIAALAVSDILLIADHIFLTTPVLALSKWPFHDIFCQLHGILNFLCVSASVLVMAAAAVNRYFQVVRRNYYRLIFTPRRTKLIICAAWMLACITPTQYLASGGRYIFNPGKCFCFQEYSLQLNTWLVYANVFISMNVIILCYYKIFRTIQNHQAAMKENRNSISGPSTQDIKVTRTLFLTVVGFLICWTPILVIDIIDFVKGEFALPRELYFLYTYVGVLSSVINPFIYGAMNPMFREEYKKVFRIATFRGRNSAVVHVEAAAGVSSVSGRNRGANDTKSTEIEAA
ncbi:predicted protein [Nematostella vectensis]|uniref:G-protein coupled receptors family 1 profile domain-containing protein n=1 Tax=Nematostella vectensis TaxID=45351 RepID=A7SYQ9_NEMVE|nr:predicted protein [Nematostella vectensis]|eukprot:XP_001623250.1 predicted protein [Nematostella vectensis]